MERVDVGPPAAVKVQVVFDGGPTGYPGEQPFVIHPKSTAEVTLKQICSLFEIEEHYSHFGLYNNETGREVYSTGVVKDNDHLRLKPLPAQKFISRAEVIISKSPLMASKALKHLNDHFIILATNSNNNNVVGSKGMMVVDSVFVSPFLIETIVKVIITKPYFVDLLVRLVNFPKIRVALNTSFLGNARRAVTPAPFSHPSSPSHGHRGLSPFSHAPPSPLSFSVHALGNRSESSHQISHSSSIEELSRIHDGMPTNYSSPDLQELEFSSSSSSILSSFAYTSSIRAPTPLEQSNSTPSKYSRDLGTRKLDVFTLVRDTLTNARLPPPFTDFFRYLLSDKMNEGIVTRCVLLLNCMLGIAELTVVWGDVDESDLVGLPSDITSSFSQGLQSSVDGNTEPTERASYGIASGAANRYVAFKHGIRTAGVIDALTTYAMQENPIAPLRSAISGFQDHLFRPLDMLALGALDYKKHAHGKLLERIWWAAFPDTTYPGHLADDWRFIGFRGNPFLTPSQTLISIHAFAHFARNNTKLLREILIEQSELSFNKKGFPLGSLAAHLSSMLVNFYQLGILRRDPRLVKYFFGPDPSELFYRLFDTLVIMMNEMWKRAGFTSAQFLQSIRIMKNILHRAHVRDPPSLEVLQKLIRQFIEEDFPENTNSHPRIVLKRSTFVLDDSNTEIACTCADADAGTCALHAENKGHMDSPRIYVRSKDEDEMWRKEVEKRRQEEEEAKEEADGVERQKLEKERKATSNTARLERFFGESPEEGYQFAPQPPNVKLVKLKRIFGESVDTNGFLPADPEMKEYNKRYRDSLNEDQLKKLEVERAHRLHAFFGEWFDTTDANKTIKHTKKPSSPDITDLIVIKKISIPPPNEDSSTNSVPTIHLSVQPPSDFSSPLSSPDPQTQTLALSLNHFSSPSNSPCSSPRSILEPSAVPELTITSPDTITSHIPSIPSTDAEIASELVILASPDSPSSDSIPYSIPTNLISSPELVTVPDIKPNGNNIGESHEHNTDEPHEHIEKNNNSTNTEIDFSDTGSSSAAPLPVLSPLGRSSSTPSSTPPSSSSSSPSSASSSPSLSRSQRVDSAWRPALNRTASAPNNDITGSPRPRLSKRLDTSIGTRSPSLSLPLRLRSDETASSSSSIADDTASYISNTDIDLSVHDEEKPRNSGSVKGLSFFRLSKWFSKHDSSSRPPSPTTNKRLKRNILKQLFGDRINKDLTDLMNEPSIKHEKTASSTRRVNNTLPPVTSYPSSSLSSSSSSSSSAPSSASSSPQPSLRHPTSPRSPRENLQESEIQALTRFRFMNRMKSKSSTSIPMAAPHHYGHLSHPTPHSLSHSSPPHPSHLPSSSPSHPLSHALSHSSPPHPSHLPSSSPSHPLSHALSHSLPSPPTPSKRYHTFSIRKPSYPRLQVYQI